MCNMKFVIKIGAAIGILLIIAYGVFPTFRAGIASVAPFLLFLACPAAMYIMMKGMNNQNQRHDGTDKKVISEKEPKK
jgi:hypothetical protein